MMKSIVSVAGLVAAVAAYTPPVQPPTYGSLLTPNGENGLVTGQSFVITWEADPTEDVTVSLVLCNGPSSNCVTQSTAIVEGVPAAGGSYTWSVPCDLPLGTANTATGYGMLVIVDGTGEFQYSTQFSVTEGASCADSGPTTTTSATTPGPSHTDTESTWIAWSSSQYHNSTTIAGPTVISSILSSVTTAAPISSAPASSSALQTTVRPSTTTAASTSAQPVTFTGAAALPTAFMNLAGVVGAAGLAIFAL